MITPETPDQTTEEYKNVFDFGCARVVLKDLFKGFTTQDTTVQANRQRRKVDVNVEQARKDGDLKQDETLTPMRVIDEAISREKPGYIAYLQQSRRLVILADVLEPDKKHDKLEAQFTRGMTYHDWILAHHKTLDGAQLHGWDWAEVVYDTSYPLHVAIEHVGSDRLIFPLDTEDIQNCSRIARKYMLSRTQLNYFVKQFGFDAAQVQKLIAMERQKTPDASVTKDHLYIVYKVYAKFDEVVYVSWYADSACDSWLKAPEKFYNGVDVQADVPDEMTGMITKQWVPAEETAYPFVLLAYEETEEKEIYKKIGRAFKDKYKQEVMTTGWSSFLNGHNRAMNLYAAKDTNDGIPASQLESEELKHGKVYPYAIKFYNTPVPDPGMLQALQAFDSKIATSAGQMTYAVQSKSSGARTTATEVESAQRDTNLLASVNITLFSAYVRNCYNKAWRIVQCQALQNNIQLYGRYEVNVNPLDGTQSLTFVNNVDEIGRKYDVRPAGDVDVIQRDELIQSMMAFWPVVQNTPIALPFLAKLLRTRFAEDGEIWAQQLAQGDIKSALLAQYMEVVSAALASPGELSAIGPAEVNALKQLVLQTQEVLNGSANGQQNSGSVGGAGQMATPAGNNEVPSGTQSTEGQTSNASM